MMTSTDSDVQEARVRVLQMLRDLRGRGIDLEQLGEDLDLLLNATAPREETEFRQLPKPRPAWERIRRTDPSTSWIAARMLAADTTRKTYDRIAVILSREALTDEELVYRISLADAFVSPSGVRSRRAELAEAGWVRDTGERRNTKAGRPAIVWEWVPSVDS